MAQPFESSQTQLQSSVNNHSGRGEEQDLELHSQRLEEKQARLDGAQVQHLPSPPQPSDAGGSTTSSTPIVNTKSAIATSTAATEAYDVQSRTDEGAKKGSSTVQSKSIEHEQAGHDSRTPATAIAPKPPSKHLHSPTMANSQPPPGHPRHAVSYPGPPAYAHGPMAPMAPAAHYAYPPQPGPQGDLYRGSPPVNNPMTLPNIRSLDPMPSQHHGIAMAGTLAPSAPPMAYYNIPPPNPYLHQDPNGMRYALPPNLVTDPRIAMSGGRHKKEIKRRTKTGCLTCRKRRIKCDEGHPTCNNCKKSKRECLGYDPIFKPQPAPGSMQGGPSNQASPVTTFAPTPTVPSSAPQLPYHTPTPIVPSSYPPSSVSLDSPTPPTSRSFKSEGGFDYGQPAIDPALQIGGDHTGPNSLAAAPIPHSHHFNPGPASHSPHLISHTRDESR